MEKDKEVATKPLIRTLLDMSTGHVDERTMNWITSEQFEGCSYDLIYGALVLVETCPRALKALNKTSPDLVNCFKFAAACGCTYIKFDGDGEVYSQLKKYDW
jgi:hypothetical protein